jgi:hypothetical protein
MENSEKLKFNIPPLILEKGTHTATGEEIKEAAGRLSQLQPRKILFSDHFIDNSINNTERLNTVLDETF